MIRLKVTNLSQFDTEVRAWKARVEAATAQVAKGVAMFTLKAILKTSPQYSGDFVANWNVSIGSPDYTFNPLPVGEFSHYTEDFSYLSKEGDPRAISVALSKVSIGAYKLGQTIWLTNAAHHDDNYQFSSKRTGSSSGQKTLAVGAWSPELFKRHSLHSHASTRKRRYALPQWGSNGYANLCQRGISWPGAGAGTLPQHADFLGEPRVSRPRQDQGRVP